MQDISTEGSFLGILAIFSAFCIEATSNMFISLSVLVARYALNRTSLKTQQLFGRH